MTPPDPAVNCWAIIERPFGMSTAQLGGKSMAVPPHHNPLSEGEGEGPRGATWESPFTTTTPQGVIHGMGLPCQGSERFPTKSLDLFSRICENIRRASSQQLMSRPASGDKREEEVYVP